MPKVTIGSIRKIVLTIVLSLTLFAGGYYIGNRNKAQELKQQYPEVTIDRDTPANQQNLDFSLFWRVWDTVNERYYDKNGVIPAKMVYGAIQGMVASVGDPYTVFLPPSENKVVQEDLKGNFEGVGIQIGFKGAYLAVIAPLPDSPAQKAGIRAGDYILEIKDPQKDITKGTSGITVPEAVELIRGEAGTKVTLTLLRAGSDDPIVADLTREKIDIPSIVLTTVGEKNNIAHLQVTKFSEETLSEWNDAVLEIVKNPEIKGIVLDVRNNPGGYMQRAVDLASDFLDTGSTVVIEESGNGHREVLKTAGIPRLRSYKTVILVNAGSASASEILAGALRDQINTKIIGTKTFGKGTIQESEQISGGSGLHITIAKWLTPKGTWVHTNGLDPDVKIENNSEDSEEDQQLDEAVKMVLTV